MHPNEPSADAREAGQREGIRGAVVDRQDVEPVPGRRAWEDENVRSCWDDGNMNSSVAANQIVAGDGYLGLPGLRELTLGLVRRPVPAAIAG
jgi:hypothetical protein